MISIGGAREIQQSAWQNAPSDKTSAESVARLRNVRVGLCGGSVLRTVGVAGDLDSTAPVFLAVVGLPFPREPECAAACRDWPSGTP
jgi:hypothetical protein